MSEEEIKYYIIGWNGEFNRSDLLECANGEAARMYGSGSLPKGFMVDSNGKAIGEYSRIFPRETPENLRGFEHIMLVSSEHVLLPIDCVINQHPTPVNYLSA